MRRLLRVLALAPVLFFSACTAQPSSGTHDSNSAPSGNTPPAESRLARMKRTGIVRIGYGGYAPYLVEGQSSGEVSGFAVDLITQILHVADGAIKVAWVPTKFDRLILDFQSDKYDLVVEPLIQTLPRAMQLGISTPYTYIGYGIPVVRAQEQRFKSVPDIDQPGIVVAVTSTASSDQFAQRGLHKATLHELPAGTLDQPFLEVLAGRADVALADEVTIRGFLDQHRGTLRALSIESAPEKLGAGFLLPQGDYTWATFLNAGIAYMQTTGQMKRLAQLYHVPYYELGITRVTQDQ